MWRHRFEVARWVVGREPLVGTNQVILRVMVSQIACLGGGDPQVMLDSKDMTPNKRKKFKSFQRHHLHNDTESAAHLGHRESMHQGVVFTARYRCLPPLFFFGIRTGLSGCHEHADPSRRRPPGGSLFQQCGNAVKPGFVDGMSEGGSLHTKFSSVSVMFLMERRDWLKEKLSDR